MTNGNSAHLGPVFLVWHAMFNNLVRFSSGRPACSVMSVALTPYYSRISQLEQMLQLTSAGAAAVCQPYWDWTLDGRSRPRLLVWCLRACVIACLHACVLACLRACPLACLRACVIACLHACVLACLRACALACLRACVLACLRACVRVCLRACVLACLRACVLASLRSSCVPLEFSTSTVFSLPPPPPQLCRSIIY